MVVQISVRDILLLLKRVKYNPVPRCLFIVVTVVLIDAGMEMHAPLILKMINYDKPGII